MGNLISRIKAWHNQWSWQFGGPVQNNNLEAPVTGVHFCVSGTSPFSLNRGTTFLRDWQNMRHKIILQYFGGHGPNASGFDHAVLHEIYSLVQIWKHLLPARQRKRSKSLFVPICSKSLQRVLSTISCGKLLPESQAEWFLRHHVHVAMCTFFEFVRLCVQSMKIMYVAFTSHICITFHYINNTMAYNIQQNITITL